MSNDRKKYIYINNHTGQRATSADFFFYFSMTSKEHEQQ